MAGDRMNWLYRAGSGPSPLPSPPPPGTRAVGLPQITPAKEQPRVKPSGSEVPIGGQEDQMQVDPWTSGYGYHCSISGQGASQDTSANRR